MGLGKTIQTISFFAYLYEYKKIRGPHLIVCPNSVVHNWHREFSHWLPNMRVVKLIARKEQRYDIINDFILPKNFDVIITSFEGVNICMKTLRRIKWVYIVVDEAHRIKNDQSLLSQTLRKFKTEMKLLITGTPLQNNLKELWSLLNFILPEIFDDAELFEEQMDKDQTQEEVEKKNIELIKQLHKILRPFLLKRTKAVIDKSIPPKKEIHVYVGLTKLQTEIYKNLLLKKAPTENSNKTSMMNILMHLRKACNHPYLFEGVEDQSKSPYGDHLVTSSGKMIILDKILEKLKYNHQVIIFSQFKIMLDILEDYMIYKEFKYCRIDGGTYLDEREQQIQDFTSKTSDKFVFLLSTRAGGLGINLTTADTVILYDSDWNPQVDLQAMDRAHRIGQTKTVMVYRLITEHTIEEKIVERQKVKLKWDNLVILKGKVSQKQKLMNKNELFDLIQYGANQIFKASEGTIKNEDLDMLLERGEKKAQEMNEQIDNYIKEKGEKLLDLGINTINIYEFEGADYLKKRQTDKEVLQQMKNSYFDAQKYERMNKKKQMNGFKEVPKKIVTLPDYQLFDEREKLEVLMTKDANSEFLSDQEIEMKNRLYQSGFPEITKKDFYAIIRALEKYPQEDFASISQYIDKNP